jgi:polyhydroxyalkanoate synthesis regulator phasin
VSHEKLDRLTAERDEVVAEFEKARQEIDAKVQEKLAEAGLSDLLRNAQAELEGHRQKAQSRVDFLTGQISMLEEVLGVKSAQA